MILSVIITIGFGTDASITNAYGVTICTMMILTTILYACVMFFRWRMEGWKVGLFCIFLVVDLFFWGSVILKIPLGGWVAIVFSCVFLIPMLIWYVGEYRLRRYWHSHRTSTPIQLLPSRLREMQAEGKIDNDSSSTKDKIISTNDVKNESTDNITIPQKNYVGRRCQG